MLRPLYKQPIHHWVQKFVDNSARYIIFLFEKTNRKRCNLEHQTNFIMNANQLYTTEHKMPRFLRVNDQNFEYVNRNGEKYLSIRWKFTLTALLKSAKITICYPLDD